MIILKNNLDDVTFDNLEDAKSYYIPNTEEFPECINYVKEIEQSETMEELADVLNRHTDNFGDGRHHFVKDI